MKTYENKKSAYKSKKNFHKKKNKFRKHTINRLRERYEVDFNNEDLKNMKELILIGKTKPIKALSNSRTIHKIYYKKLSFIVIYNKNYKEIATALRRKK